MNEVLRPHFKALEATFEHEFIGMLREPVQVDELEDARNRLLDALAGQLTSQDAKFLLSFKRGKPDWSLCLVHDVADLPAVRWKLMNITRMKRDRHVDALGRLEDALEWLQDRIRG